MMKILLFFHIITNFAIPLRIEYLVPIVCMLTYNLRKLKVIDHMKNIAWFTKCLSKVLLVSSFSLLCLPSEAQYDESTADLSLVSPTTDGDWNTTYHSGMANEITLKATGASVSSRQTCESGGKKDALSFSSSDSHWLDIYVPDGTNATIAHIKFNPVGNSSGGPWTEYVWTSTSSTFNTSAAGRLSFSLPGYSLTCSNVEMDIPAGVKSIRLYRRVKATDNGNGTYSLGSGTNTGSGQTYALHSFYVWLNKGPEMKAYKVTYGGVQYEGVITNTDVLVTVPYATDLTQGVVPDEISLTTGASYKSGSNTNTSSVTLSESIPVVYTLTDGENEKTYSVLAAKIPASNANSVLSYQYTYTLGGTPTNRQAEIDNGAGTIAVTLPYSFKAGQDNAALATAVPTTFTWSPLAVYNNGVGGTVTGESCDVTMDYTAANSFVITSESGIAKTYTVNVGYDAAQTGKQIESFVFVNGTDTLKQTCNLDHANGTINITVGPDAVLSSLTPGIVTSYMAKVSPLSGVANDFTSPKTYTVTAEDGATKTYVVTVTKDVTAPVLTVTKPANGATDAPLSGKIIVTLDEPCRLAGGIATAVLTGPSYNSDLTSKVTQLTDTTFAFAFTGLTSLTNYTFTIGTGFFEDLYGNKQASVVSAFKTADAVWHSTDGDYVSLMDAENFEQPAFIQGEATYNDSICTRGATVNLFGAYQVDPGETLTLTTDFAAVLDIIVFCLDNNGSYTIADAVNTLSGAFSKYENHGKEEFMACSAGTITFTNNGSTTLYVPYLSLSAGGQITDKDAHCK